jgi:hypothetical protein
MLITVPEGNPVSVESCAAAVAAANNPAAAICLHP